MNKAEKRQQQPSLQFFASPTITPSNNFKIATDSSKDANLSLILGRKIDSPQLIVGKDPSERREQISGMQIGLELDNPFPEKQRRKKDPHINLSLAHNPLLNQTNKEIQTHHFDLNIQQPKANVTIQYESLPNKQLYSSKNKNIKQNQFRSKERTQSKVEKKRNNSQSAPAKGGQKDGQILWNGGQPVINLQIKNVKGLTYGSQPKPNHPQQKQQQQPLSSQQKSSQVQKSLNLKFAPGNYQLSSKSQTKHKKTKSEYKALSKSQLKNHQNYSKMMSNVQQRKFDDEFIWDKENQDVNVQNKKVFSYEKIHKKENSLSSLSNSSKNAFNSGQNKMYFMDKSTLLKQLSAEKPPHTLLSNREEQKKPATNIQQLKSNGSTINAQNIDKRQFKSKTGNGSGPKILFKGIDKIIKENLKKNKHKEEEEIVKKYLEDYRQKQKKFELSQRNQEVRKINASKIIYNHQHKMSVANQQLLLQQAYKKHRSKSCMNKTENIFHNVVKSREKLHQVIPQEERKEKKREKSFVLEIKNLQKEIDEEIKREIQEGKLDIPHSSSNKRTNFTTLNVKKDLYSQIDANQSVLQPKKIKMKDLSYFQNRSKKRSKSRENKMNSNKIKKFIERKKKAQMMRKSLEQTLEQDKQQKIKENLNNLNKFVKQHMRHKSHNYVPTKKQPQQVQPQPQPVFTKPTQHQHRLKKLKPHLFQDLNSNRKENEDSSNMFLQGEMMFDQHNQGRDFDNEEEDIEMMTEKKIGGHAGGRDGDVSREFQEEYANIINSYQKHYQREITKSQNQKQNVSQSIEKSPKRQKKPQKQLKMKIRVPSTKKEDTAKLNPIFNELDSSPDTQLQLTAIKNEHVPIIPANQVQSIIPPVSDITTLEKQLEKSNIIIKDSTERNSMQKINKMTESKSPQTVEFKRKMKILMQRYGGKNATNDTKLLIKLHSAAITIQQNVRKFLNKKGFYQQEYDSDMYINSETEDQHPPQQTLKPNLFSPLRVKNLSQQQEFFRKEQKQASEFYGDLHSDEEKVVVCSVISSVREGDESLSGTQKYVPLRQKQQNKVYEYDRAKPLKQIVKREQQKQISMVREEQDNVGKGEDSERSIKKKVPALDLGKLQHENKSARNIENMQEESGTSRSLFDRSSFQDFQTQLKQKNFSAQGIPEIIRLQEEAIKYREQVEGKYIDKMLKNKMITPRTHQQKRRELEIWVTKEKEEVKKTKKVFEQQWNKTAQMIEQTHKNQEIMKKIMLDSGRVSLPSRREQLEQNTLLSSQRLGSARGESKLIELINQREQEEKEKQREEQEEQLRMEADKMRLIEEEIRKKRQQDEEEMQKRKQEQQKKLQEQQQREQEKQRQQEEQQKKQEQLEKQRKLEEQKRQQELEKKREEEIKLKKQQEEKEKQKALEIEAERKKKEAEGKKKQELLEFERKQKEDREKKEQELEKKKKEQEAKEKKEQEKRKWEEQYNLKMAKMQAKFNQQPEPQPQKLELYQPSVPSEAGYIDEPHFTDQDFFSENESKLLQQLTEQNKKGKVVEESIPSEEEKIGGIDGDDVQKGLSRTRNSQDLQDNKEFEGEVESQLMQDSSDQLSSSKEQQKLLQEQRVHIHSTNFFTKDYDDENEQELMTKLEQQKNSTISEGLHEIIEEVKKDIKEKGEGNEKEVNEKIYIEDEGEQIKPAEGQNNISLTSGKNQDDSTADIPNSQMSPIMDTTPKHPTPSQNMTVSIVDYSERTLPQGLPVSPISADNLDIYTGGQSLDSTLSDKEKLRKELQTEDIADDIFKMLMNELKVELDLLLLREARTAMREEQNYLLSESGRFLIFERKGIKTDLFAIERYVEEVLEEVLKEKKKFMLNINDPITRKPLDTLNQLQNSEIGSYDHFDITYPCVLPLDLYLKLEKRRKENREKHNSGEEEGKNARETNDKNFLAEPYGKDGAPLPWSRQNRRLKPIEDFTIEEMFEIVKHDLFRWAIMQAGTLPRKEFVFGGVFDDELFAEIREKKLATLLAREMIENEQKWLNYEFEEAQVKIDIGDMILEQLVTETITVLNKNVNRQI